METFERKEYKYFVPVELLDTVRRRFMANMVHDPYCLIDGRCHPYTVRSIYLDTRNYLFYAEKADGLKVRKKLRIRTYGALDQNALAFLEIKRKFGNTIYKERVKTLLPETPHLFNGSLPRLLNENPSFLDRTALNKFAYLTKRLQLTPKVLITYEREALFGIDDDDLRITFDLNVRSFPHPEITEIFMEKDLRTINDESFVLEIKFSRQMPIWVRQIIREYRFRVQSISKYCKGIDMWTSVNEEVVE